MKIAKLMPSEVSSCSTLSDDFPNQPPFVIEDGCAINLRPSEVRPSEVRPGEVRPDEVRLVAGEEDFFEPFRQPDDGKLAVDHRLLQRLDDARSCPLPPSMTINLKLPSANYPL